MISRLVYSRLTGEDLNNYKLLENRCSVSLDLAMCSVILQIIELKVRNVAIIRKLSFVCSTVDLVIMCLHVLIMCCRHERQVER